MRNALILFSVLILSGCSSFSFKDNLSDVGAATVATAAAAVSPVAGIVTGIATGVTINTITKDDVEVDLAQVTNVHQEEVAKTQVIADTVESLGIIGTAGAIIAFIIIPWIIGRITPRRREIELAAREDERKRRVEARLD